MHDRTYVHETSIHTDMHTDTLSHTYTAIHEHTRRKIFIIFVKKVKEKRKGTLSPGKGTSIQDRQIYMYNIYIAHAYIHYVYIPYDTKKNGE